MALAANRARFAFHIAGCEDELRVLRFNGTEAIAGLFDWTIEVVSRNPALKLKQLLGCDALLQIDLDSGSLQKPRLVHGTVRAAVQFQASRRWTYYRIHLAPRLYWLGLRHNLRIFQNLSAPEILQQLLTEAGFDTASYRFELTRTYQPRPYCVQYNESELNFLQRLLSDEGIHYHFEHREDRHVLVIGDHGGSFRPLKGSPFKLRNDVQMVGEPVILQFTPSCKVSVDAVTRNDYDFRRPQHSLLSEARDTPAPRLEHYAWPGNYNDLDQGQRRTQDRLEAHQVNQQQAHGESVISQLVAGTSFCLTLHPNPTLNRDWLLLNIHHKGEQPQVLEEEAPDQQGSSYSNQFQAMPADLPYRPPVSTSRPRIRGIQTAVVVGPPGEQIYTDEHGRIQVRFHWDRDGQHARSGGTVWLRLVQSWAGSFWGSQILPRVGQEVIVTFLHGDPDQPVVSGCLYHGLHKPPYPLPEHKSRTLLRSQSLTGQGGHELMLEDASGREKIAVHSHRDLELHVTRNATAAIDRHAQTRVGGNSFSAIQGTQHCTVEGERRTRIDGDDSLTVDAALHLKAGTNIHHQAGQEIHLKAGGSLFIDAGMELSFTAGASALSLNPAGVFLNGPAINLNSGGGAGSAKAAGPKVPELPVKTGKKKAGNATDAWLEKKALEKESLEFTNLSRAQAVAVAPVSPAPSAPQPPANRPPAIPRQFPPELFGQAANDSQFRSSDKLGDTVLRFGSRLLGLIGLLGYSSKIGKTISWTDEQGIEYTKHSDELFLTATHPDGHKDLLQVASDATLWHDGKVVATIDDDLITHPVSPQDDVAYRAWLAKGGEGGFQEWVSQGKPDHSSYESSHLIIKIQSIKKLRLESPDLRIEQLAWDPDSGKYRMQEARTAFEIEEKYGYFDRYQRPSPHSPKGDFIAISGKYKDQTFDDFGSEINEGMIRQIQRKPNQTKRKFFESLENHLQESDHVILNLTKLKKDFPSLYTETIEYVSKHPNKHKVIDVTK